MEKRSRAAYMREYRRRKREGLPTIRQQAQATNHQACDAEITALHLSLTQLRARVMELEEENAGLRDMLPF